MSNSNQRLIKPPLGLIDPDHLKPDEQVLVKLNYEMFPDRKTLLLKKGSFLVKWNSFFDPFDKVYDVTQEEFPFAALHWMIDRIENGFWKKPTDGGLPNTERRVSKLFDDELIGINVAMHCCAENLPGYIIRNANRKSYITDTPPQEWHLPRYMLREEGFLDRLKDIWRRHEAGQL